MGERAVRGLAAMAAICVLAVLPAAASAQATTDMPVPGYLLAGPVLVGGTAVAVDSDVHAARSLRAYEAGAASPRELTAFNSVLGDNGYFELAGSTTRLTVAREGTRSGTAALLSGPIDGPATLIARCRGDQVWRPLLADADRLLFTGPSDRECRRRSSAQARDLSQDPPAALDAPPVAPADFDWPYAVWVEDAMDAKHRRLHVDVVVYDVSTHAEAYRVRVPDIDLNDQLPIVTVDSDGRVVAEYVRASRAGGRSCGLPMAAITATPAAPVPQRLSQPPCRGFLRLRGGRLVAVAGGPTGGGLAARTLPDGAPVPISASFLSDDEIGTDYDGTSIAFVELGCTGGYRVIVDDVDAAIARGPYPVGSCSAELEVLGRPLDRHDGLRVRVTCPTGCSATLRLRAARHRIRTVREPLLSVAPGGSTVVAMRLDREERRKTHRHRRVRGQVVAFVSQPSSNTRVFRRDFALHFRR